MRDMLYLLKASLESLDDRRGKAFMLHLVQAFDSYSAGCCDLVDFFFGMAAVRQKKFCSPFDRILDDLSSFFRSESDLDSSF